MGSAGTIQGVVSDPAGLAIPGAEVRVLARISGYTRTARTDASGSFQLFNLPPNAYHVAVVAKGFNEFEQDLDVRSNVPISLKIALVLEGGKTSVTVDAHESDFLENVPFAHNDMDRETYGKLATLSPGSGLSDAITQGAPGVVADSNGFFHPLGDHAQVLFSVDNQPISDQQSKAFSTQMPLNALESMELISGAPNAEFGDKTSLVVNAVTRSALGHKGVFGSFEAQYGSFGTGGMNTTLGIGGQRIANFLVVNGMRSGRFLDTPEFRPIHAAGNNQTVFNRLDWKLSGSDTLHLNILAARNWFQVPNTYDQAAVSQDQRQQVRTFNIAPGYQKTISPHALFTLSPFFRRDQVEYYPSRDEFADTPATIQSVRKLANFGFKTDLAYFRGRHNFKTGGQVMQTRLSERFQLGITDSHFNPVCFDPDGEAVMDPKLRDPEVCEKKGYRENPDLQPGLIPFDLTRGGALLNFRAARSISQGAGFVQDQISLGALNLNAGLRVDRYNGISSATGVQPRIGASYLSKRTGTVLRASFSRTFETPYNENLLLSSTTGAGGLASNVFGAFGSTPIQPGRRNQFNAGLQQKITARIVADADYFWKYTDSAFDFGVLFNTPITFPVQWKRSKIDGISARINLADYKGFAAYTLFGHTRARFFGPSNGGLVFNSPLETTVFRIDHDQAFQQNTHLRYQMPKGLPWLAFTWRYDSGLVAGAVGSLEDALALTAAQQAAIGFSCGSQIATVARGITACDSGKFGATRIRIPAPGTDDPDHNPPRIAPRHLFDAGIGSDNLFRSEHRKVTLRLQVVNLTNRVALYNFLSTFGGTHFVTPRSYTASVGIVF